MREAAANGLGRIGDAHAVEPLIAALKDRDYDVREAVAWALGQIGDTRAVEPLLATLKDENKGVQESAAKALVKLHETRKLNQEHKQLLLAHRSVFPEAWHEDRTYHEDDACTRYYYEQHEDKSGGVQFPL
jgi:HEAT repeat protein